MTPPTPPGRRRVPIGPAALAVVCLGFWFLVALAMGRDSSALVRWSGVLAVSVATAAAAGALLAALRRRTPEPSGVRRIVSGLLTVVFMAAVLGVVVGFAATVWMFGNLIFPAMFGG